jgi:histidine triad (HIT) family protein
MSHETDCLFCKIVAGDIPASIVYENDHVVGFKDINPHAPVHVLMVPREHVATLNDLDDDHADLVGQLVLAARDYAAAEGFADDGYRVLMNCNANAGQTVFHLHLHVLAGARLSMSLGTGH